MKTCYGVLEITDFLFGSKIGIHVHCTFNVVKLECIL